MGPLGPVIPLSPIRTGMGVALSTAPAAQTRRSSRAQNVSNYERTSLFLSHFNRQRESHFVFHIVLAALPCQAPRGLAGSAPFSRRPSSNETESEDPRFHRR